MRSRLSRTAVSGMPTITESRAEPDEIHVDFDIDQMSIDAVNGGAAGLEKSHPRWPRASICHGAAGPIGIWV